MMNYCQGHSSANIHYLICISPSFKRVLFIAIRDRISFSDPPTVPKFPYFVPESRSIIRQYELSDFVSLWFIDIPETWINEETNM